MEHKTDNHSAGPVGIGGWLFLLVLMLTILGPMIAAVLLHKGIADAELQVPNLAMARPWVHYKMASWLFQAVVAMASIYAGFGLALRRDTAVVMRAHVVLWFIGPGTVLVQLLILQVFIGTDPNAVPSFIFSMIKSCVPPLIWTAYLSHSNRVRNTYGQQISENHDQSEAHGIERKVEKQ